MDVADNIMRDRRRHGRSSHSGRRAWLEAVGRHQQPAAARACL